MTKMSSPRTFSSTSTKTSISAKRRMLALVSGILSAAEIASLSGRLLLQAISFMRAILAWRRFGERPNRSEEPSPNSVADPPGRESASIYQGDLDM